MNLRRLGSLLVTCASALVLLGAPALAAENASATSLSTANNPMTVFLDARLAPRGIMVTHMRIPVRPGPFTLVYPKWIPGEHGPTGPLNDLALLRISAKGKVLPWRRDKINMYAFHVNVPQGVSRLHVRFHVLLNAPGDTMADANLAIVNWNRDLLYQNDTNSHQVFVNAGILLPPGWQYGTALPIAKSTGNRIDFSQTTLATLVDSPLDMGRYARHIVLWKQGGASQTLDAFADAPQYLAFPKKLIAEYKHVAPEAIAMYGGRHWIHYHSLLTLSNAIGFQGIEHHSSSDDRAPATFMTNPQWQYVAGDLLTHEFSHSWNGKYRRPADLTTPNFQVPMQTDLLWVYEGMNQYLGDLISFRAGIRKPSAYPQYLATLYAAMDNEPGRYRTPLIDLTTAAPYLYQVRGDYPSLRRTAGDFYTEGELMWLDVDTIIRAKTDGKKSLDTFLHLYAGGTSAPNTITYTRGDIEHLLNEVVPYHWHAFFQKYVYSITQHPPNPITRAGWKIVYTNKPNPFMSAASALSHSIPAWYSLGVRLSGGGTIYDVRRGSAAWKAGLAPHMTIEAINGQTFSPAVFSYMMKQAQKKRTPMTLLIHQNGWFNTYVVNYTGGMLYPHLVRIKGKPNMLAAIMKPLTWTPKKSKSAKK
ncbi:MAG: M61 family metallopeptidase [Vulcanimicrobiaceae bacterium]